MDNAAHPTGKTNGEWLIAPQAASRKPQAERNSA